MSKLSAVEGKLSRIHEQIEAAQGEVADIDGELSKIARDLTSELSKIKPNDEAVVSLEAKRAALTTSRTRLQARVAALSGTIPGMEAAINKAALTDEIATHKELIAQINNGVKLWEAKAREIGDLEAIAETIRADRRRLADIGGHVRYLAAATGADIPKLSDAGHVSNAAILNLRSSLRAALETEVGYYRGIWDERTDELARSTRETVKA